MLKFSANLSMMFADRPFLDRFGAASAGRFRAVEFLLPLDWPIEALSERIRRYTLDVTLMNMAPGDWSAGERGLACLPDRVDEFRRDAARTIEYARKLKCTRLHCVAGLTPGTARIRDAERCYIDNVLYAAKECREAGIELLIEPINTEDIPGYFLASFDKAMTLMNIMAEKGGPQPKLQFDIYHCAKIHGEVPQWIERCGDRIGYYQIAGIPDRHEPDVGLLPLDDILAAVKQLNIDTWIGCEYRPRQDVYEGLNWIDDVRAKFDGKD